MCVVVDLVDSVVVEGVCQSCLVKQQFDYWVCVGWVVLNQYMVLWCCVEVVFVGYLLMMDLMLEEGVVFNVEIFVVIEECLL